MSVTDFFFTYCTHFRTVYFDDAGMAFEMVQLVGKAGGF